MTPIINPWLFYLVDVMDNLKFECLFIPMLFLLYMLSIAYTKEEDINEEKIVKIVKKLIICFGLMFTVESFLPSKKACYQMMIASQVTKENIQKAEDTIKSSVDYIFEKINEK